MTRVDRPSTRSQWAWKILMRGLIQVLVSLSDGSGELKLDMTSGEANEAIPGIGCGATRVVWVRMGTEVLSQ